MRRAIAMIGCGATLGTTAQAQIINVSLREGPSQTVIVGAVVRLVRDTSVVAQALTNAGGRAGLRAPAPGTYRIRINRIGFAPILTDTVTLVKDQILTKEIAVDAVAMALPTLEVKTKSECGGPVSNGALAGAVWEQIRSALAANVLTERVWAIPLLVKTFHRELSLDSDSLSEVVTGQYVAHGPPFASPDPAKLLSKGYAYLAGDEMAFGAPDAALLLTDEFARTHCFRAIGGATEDVVGLAFEPTPRRRLSDVRGTLWVNRRTSELQYLEYSYTNLPPELADLGLRGRIDFRHLPTGAWIVSAWKIRMPKMDANTTGVDRRNVRGVDGQRFQTHPVGYVEDGGRVTVDASAAIANAIVTGLIFDSTTSSPLADAIVRIQGDSGFSTSELNGRFTLTTTTGGTRTITVTHPKLGFIDDGSTRAVNLSIGDSAVVNVNVPSAARVARDLCGPAANRSGLVGLTWVDGATTEDLDVQVTWGAGTGGGEEHAQSGPRGIYALCDLPPNQSLVVRLRRGTTVLVEQTILLSASDFRWVELTAKK